MEISTRRNRLGQHHTRSVHCFPNSLKMTASRDFLDEDRCEAFGTQFLVDTEEIDFNCGEGVVADTERDWDT